MAEIKPPVVLELVWDGHLAFTAREGRHTWALDGRCEAGPTPVSALAAAIAGCMAIDVVHILTRGRFRLRSLKTSLTGQRAPNDPKRFVGIDLRFTIDGDAPPDQIERAIALSREKYCSVWHSMRQDIDLTTSVSIVGPEP